jgi:hypothetical protein
MSKPYYVSGFTSQKFKRMVNARDRGDRSLADFNRSLTDPAIGRPAARGRRSLQAARPGLIYRINSPENSAASASAIARRAKHQRK